MQRICSHGRKRLTTSYLQIVANSAAMPPLSSGFFWEFTGIKISGAASYMLVVSGTQVFQPSLSCSCIAYLSSLASVCLSLCVSGTGDRSVSVAYQYK